MTETTSTPIVVPPTVQVVLISLATRGLAWLGGALVAHGIVTSDQVGQSVPPLAQALVGAAVTIAAGIWGAYRSKHKNDQLNTVAALPQVPNSVAVAQPGTPPTIVPPKGDPVATINAIRGSDNA